MAHLFVTGASAGIGRSLARLAVARGHRVTGCARRAERLDELAAELGPAFHGAVADVTDRAALDAAVAAGCARSGPIDALVANAGRGLDGELLEIDPKALLAVMDVNLAGVHRSVLASRASWAPCARVVIVSSVVAAFSVPRMGAYCATKHALDAYAAALRMELADAGHRVTTINPGTVATEFFDVAPASGGVWSWRPGRPLDPQRVAAAILDHALGGGRKRRFLPVSSRLVVAAARVAPGLVEAVLQRRLRSMRRAEPGT